MAEGEGLGRGPDTSCVLPASLREPDHVTRFIGAQRRRGRKACLREAPHLDGRNAHTPY